MKKEIKLQRIKNKILVLQEEYDELDYEINKEDLDRLDNEGGRPIDVLVAPDEVMSEPVSAAVHNPFVFNRGGSDE